MKQYALQIIILILISIVLIQLTCNKAPDNSKQFINENKELRDKIDQVKTSIIDSVEKIIARKEFNQTILQKYYVNEQGKIDLIPDDSLAKYFEWYILSRRKPGLPQLY